MKENLTKSQVRRLGRGLLGFSKKDLEVDHSKLVEVLSNLLEIPAREAEEIVPEITRIHHYEGFLYSNLEINKLSNGRYGVHKFFSPYIYEYE